jgi:hypothetical protein
MSYTWTVLRDILSWIKYRVLNRLPLKIYNILTKIAVVKRESKFYEQDKVFGDLNPSLHFLIIRKRPPGWGFFSNLFYVLRGLRYSEELGYIPVVDMENYFMSELSSLKPINGSRNAWNYFFENVSNYTLAEVYKSKNVKLSDGNRISQSTSWLHNRDINLLKNTDNMLIVRDLIDKYIKLNTQTEEYLDKLKTELSWSGEETLGIFVRGSAYYRQIYFPENTIVDFNKLVTKIDDFLEKKSFNQIYICTEDFRVYLKLCEKFKNFKILRSIRFPPSLSEKEWTSNQSTTNVGGNLNMDFHNTRTYLAEIHLLSECANFIGTFSNASAFVLAKNFGNKGTRRLILPDEDYNF